MKDISVNEQLLENYSNYYSNVDSKWRQISSVEKAKNIISLCSSYSHELVLEVGAGDGSILEKLSEQYFGKELHALEISPSGAEAIAKKKIPRVIKAGLFDGYNIPYQDNLFDLVVISHVLEHVEYPRKLLYEAGRVGKLVFVEVPLEDNWRLPLDYTFNKVGHINFYSPRTIRRLIQTCGFDILGQRIANLSKESYQYQEKTKGYIKYFIKEYLLRLFPGLAVGVFTYHQALIFRKHD